MRLKISGAGWRLRTGFGPGILLCLVALCPKMLAAQSSGHGHVRPPIPPREEIAKLPPGGGSDWNRLIFEQSPYLLQHAANPVDWFPWGEEAFAKAEKEDKPIFLSIGYATCHWCHVMERESFEDEEVAKLLNENFVCVKVDREERPDIDDVYMTVCQALTGRGGWPLTALLTHEGKPFFAGTYFPKVDKFGKPGMMTLLPQVIDAWKNHRDQLLGDADRISSKLKEMTKHQAGEGLDATVLDSAFQHLESTFDGERGGFGAAPKFPTSHRILFLLRYWKRSGNAKALEMAEQTLASIRRGGIFDQIGLGVHRYAVDAGWLIPHFEKMLYDQALLAVAYTETFQATGNPFYARCAQEILSYVRRDLTHPRGGYYSAEDADSEGEEGKFYLWTEAEIFQALGPEEGAFIKRVFELTKLGNFPDEASGRPNGANILHMKRPIAELAERENMKPEAFQKRLEKARKNLFELRERRVHPFKDDKILTDWNGLAIAAFARAGRVLGRDDLVADARAAADFVLEKLRAEDGRPLKRYRSGEAGLPAHLDDYAFLAWGLLELYESTFESRYLKTAQNLTDLMIRYFWDEAEGGFFLTANDGEALILRGKTVYDGALPSGNSVAVQNLLKLGRITAWEEYDLMAEKAIALFSEQVKRAPASFTQFLCAVDFREGPSFEIVLAGDKNAKDFKEMAAALHRRFLPNKVLLWRPEKEALEMVKISPYLEHQKSLNGKATAYVCRNFTCQKPTTDLKTMLAALEGKPNP